jgi:hypothetical protein
MAGFSGYLSERMRIESSVLGLLLLSSLAACGGGGTNPPANGAKGPAGGAADSGAPQLVTSPPPSGLPPMASMPPPGVAGSKKAKRKPDAALAACSAARPQGKEPADLVKRLGETCASSSKMKPASAMLRGSQGDKDASQENKFRAEANRCYRLYFASDDAAKDVVVVLRDSAGDIVAEAPGPAVPEEGKACFTSADEVSVVVGVGSGKGNWAAQVWSD